MIPFTLAMLRLIERIRLADRRMAAPPWSGSWVLVLEIVRGGMG
jgi:hypothetical protein